MQRRANAMGLRNHCTSIASRTAERGWRSGVAGVLAAGAVVVIAFALPGLALSLAVLCLLLPPRRWWTIWPAAAWLAFFFVRIPEAGAIEATMLVWTVGLAGGFALLSTLRPAWSATSRALAALGGSAAALVAVTVASGGMGRLDGEARAQFGALVTAWQKQVSARLPDAGTAESLRAAGERTVEQGIAVLPAVLALQLLLSLALAWWIFVRLAARTERWTAPGPLREFRFNDQLVWLAIAGLVLLLVPAGSIAGRAGANLLVFMGVLYALRGVAIFVYAASGKSSFIFWALSALAVLLAPPVLLVPLLFAVAVGVGDTWLDLRRRIALTPRG